jgi:hypothetical protein
MFKWAGVTLDLHDDGGETLKRLFPTAESLPDIIKTANIQPPEKLVNEQFALVATDSGHMLRKYAMNDAGTTAINVIYFMEHGNKLPDPARKMAAARLCDACERFGLLPPQALVKMAGDMPPFLEQDRPKKVKEIYSALKREHPDMPAEMKARIAARQGKPGKQHQGPPYKGPLTKEGAIGMGLALQHALREHEARETPEQEMLEQQTGMEANPDEIVGPGPAGFLPDANLNLQNIMSPAVTEMPEEQAIEEATGAEVRPVDLTGQRPTPKLAAAPTSDDDYAVILSNGKRLFPIDSWDNVKLAHRYFEEHEIRMEPSFRRQFAVKLAAKAEKLGYELPGEIKEAGATTYADRGHLEHCIEMRKVAFHRKSEETRFLGELFEKSASIHPEVYAECLRRFDIMNGLDKAWGSGFVDPYTSTFGIVKTANRVVWEDGADRVTEGELQNLAINGSIPLQTAFTPIFAAEFQKDPVGIFNSIPAPQKKLLARLAVDVSSQGGSEGGTIIELKRVG